MAWILLCVAVASNVAANMFFKVAMVAFPGELEPNAILKFLLSPHLWLGATCCGVLLISYLMALRELELTISYAFVISLSLIGITALSPLLLGDGLTLQRAIGVALVVVGLVLLISDRTTSSTGMHEEAKAYAVGQQDTPGT